jgi:hypothetical protein
MHLPRSTSAADALKDADLREVMESLGGSK